MAEWLGSRQADLARVVADRLDSVGARLGAGLESQAQTTGESLGRLNERLAVIDAAQSRLTEMTREVVSLKDILANKQARGAFGQGRMEAIVRDGLPAGAYDFQFTLSNRARPDCVIRLPGDARLLAVDAKFPLEGFSALRAARDEEARKAAQARVRADVGKHVKDIAERYLLPGETQDIALMFVPSEAIYSDLVEHFDDVVQKAHRARVVIVSPTLMMMAINVAQAILRDARMRDEAHEIQAEVGKLLNDVRLIVERAAKLETHFAQAQDDLNGIGAASLRIARRGERIAAMDFSSEGQTGDLLGWRAGRSRGGARRSSSVVIARREAPRRSSLSAAACNSGRAPVYGSRLRKHWIATLPRDDAGRLFLRRPGPAQVVDVALPIDDRSRIVGRYAGPKSGNGESRVDRESRANLGPRFRKPPDPRQSCRQKEM